MKKDEIGLGSTQKDAKESQVIEKEVILWEDAKKKMPRRAK